MIGKGQERGALWELPKETYDVMRGARADTREPLKVQAQKRVLNLM